MTSSTYQASAPALIEVRPRTTGEVMDDACRLALADAPVLLALSALFAVPAASLCLLLVALPVPASGAARWLLPSLAALLLPLTGIGSGACQELFRRRAEGKPAGLGTCLWAALRRGLDHVAARAMTWLLPLLTGLGLGRVARLGSVVLAPFLAVLEGGGAVAFYIFLLVVAGLLLQAAAAIGGATVHAVLVDGDRGWFAAWYEAVRENQRQVWKVLVVAGTRPVLLLLTCVNLFLLSQAGLWTAENLLGFDLALWQVVLDGNNALFLLTLALFAQLLLTPFAEAGNYLLHVDARARYEGLDLWYRVHRHFPAPERRAALMLLCALGVGLLGLGPARADSRLDAVQTARTEIGEVVQEIKDTIAYRDGQRWRQRLAEIGNRLDRDGSDRPGRYRWFGQSLAGFDRQDKAGALQVLADIDRRLALIEESLRQSPEARGTRGRSKADIKALLPPGPVDDTGPRPTTAPRPAPPEVKQPVVEDDPIEERRRARQGPGAVAPQPEGGFGQTLWFLIAAALVGCVVAALVLSQRRRPRSKPAAGAKQAPEALSLEALLSQADHAGGTGLWQQADELARQGKSLEAVRILYLAVLAMLHRADLIRYAPTRTNGDYLRQLRGRDPVQRPLRGLTGLFELKWYGERACATADFTSCRQLAEQVRAGMEAAAAV